MIHKKWIFDTLPGKSHPELWPQGLDELIDRLSKLEFLELFNEDHRLYKDILAQLDAFTKDCIKEVKNGQVNKLEGLEKGLTTIFLLGLGFGDFTYWLQALSVLDELESSQLEKSQQEQVTKFFLNNILPLLATLNFKASAAQRMHLMNDTVPEEFFRVCHYDIKEASQTAIACDDEYIYLCVSSRNGGLYKIGSGNGITKPGKVYMYRPMSLLPETVKMVVIGDTLYRSSSSFEFATLKANSKHTLEDIGAVELNCPNIRSDPASVKINKFIPLMTDGKKLFAIFKSIQLDPLTEPEALQKTQAAVEDKPKPTPSASAQPPTKQGLVPPPVQQTESFPGTLAYIQKSIEATQKLNKELNEAGRLHNQTLEQLKPKPSSKKPSNEQPQPNPFQDNQLPSNPSNPDFFFASDAIQDFEQIEIQEQLLPEMFEQIPNLPPEPRAPFRTKKKSRNTLAPPTDTLAAPETPQTAKHASNQPAEPLKKEEEEKKEEKIVEMEEFLTTLIEAYFTPERETEIEERWKKISSKMEAKINKIKGLKAPASPEKLQTVKSDLYKIPATSQPKLANKKAKDRVSKAANQEPPERERTGVMNFWLYRYDLSSGLEEINEADFKNHPLVLELQESFAGLFSIKECARAFKMNQEDIVLSAQWLIDEGEKQRTKKCINYESTTLLAQGEIDPKTLKTKGSKLPSDDVSTTHCVISDKNFIDDCIYYKGHILLNRNLYFSADPKDEYELPDDISALVLQDRKFVTPDRNRTITQKIMGKISRDERIDFDSPDLDPKTRLYYHNIANISEELKSSYTAAAFLGGNPPVFEPEPKAASVTAPVTGDKKENKRKLRGTFICKLSSALEKSEINGAKCYDHRSNIIYSLSLSKKGCWQQNPAIIVKSRDPIGYKPLKCISWGDDELFMGKLFYDGTREVEYGHSEQDNILVDEQKKSYEKFEGKTSAAKTISDLKNLLNNLIQGINNKRFSLPFKFSDPIEGINRAIKEIDIQLKRSHPPEEKKALQSKRTKLASKVSRLEKAYNIQKSDFQDNSKTVEFKRQYCFCPNGSEEELTIILKSLKTALTSKKPDDINFYMNMLTLWSFHMSINLPKDKVKSLVSLIQEQKASEGLSENISGSLESILLRLLNFVPDDGELHYSMLTLALKKQNPKVESIEEIRDRLALIDSGFFNSDSLSLMEKIYIMICRSKSYGIYHPFNQAENFKRSPNAFKAMDEGENRSKLTRMTSKKGQSIKDTPSEQMLTLLNLLHESIKESALNTEYLLRWRVYFSQFFEIWTLIENSAQDEYRHKFLKEFSASVLQFIEKVFEVVDKDNLKNCEVYSPVLEYILAIVNVLTVYLIANKGSGDMIDSDFLASKILRIMGVLMKIYKKVDNNCQGKVSANLRMNNEGLDTNQQTTFETGHPLNRGETVKANSLSHTDALGVIVQLDKRCHADLNKDFLTLYSWEGDQLVGGRTVECSVASNSHNKINVGIAFKASGKMKNEDIFVLVGDHAKIQFDANPKALENDSSLKKWGFRCRTLPLYGYESGLYVIVPSESTHLPMKIKQFSSSVIQMLNRLTVTLIRLIDPFLRGKRLNIDEKRSKEFLNWTLLKSGLTSLKTELFLLDAKQGLQLSSKMKESLSRAISRDDTKEKSVDETENRSIGSKNESEGEFLNDNQLSDLLNRLQAEDPTIIEVLNTVRGLQPQPRLLTQEKMRPRFTKELQKRWLGAENLILLTMLHHSGLLKLVLQTSRGSAANMLSLTSVKEQMEQICEKKNEILNKMVNDLQIERELSQTIENAVEIINAEIQKFKDEKERKEKEIDETKEDDKEKDTKKPTGKEALLSKLQDIQKKHGKKKTGKKSDHIQPKKDKDDKKKKKADKKDDNSKPEASAKPEPKQEEISEKPAPSPELYYEEFLNKNDISEQIMASIKDGYLADPKFSEYILVSRDMLYNPGDQESNIKDIVKFVRNIVLKSETDPAVLVNPYERISAKVEERCFFLLKIATNFDQKGAESKESANDEDRSVDMNGEEEELAPLDISRSLSSAGIPYRKNSRQQDAGREHLERRVDILQEWIQSYKNWKKSAHSNSDFTSDNCSFLASIGGFLTEKKPIDTKKLEKVMLRIAQRACFRALGLDMIKDFLQFASDTWLSRYLCGIFTAPFGGNLFDNIENLNSDVKKLIISIASQNLEFMMKRIINNHAKLREFSPNTFHKLISSVDTKGDDILKIENSLTSFFRSCSVTLSETFCLTSSSATTSNIQWSSMDQTTLRKFSKALFEFSLFSISMERLSSTCAAINTSKGFLKQIKNHSTILLERLGHGPNIEFMLEELYGLLRKELGLDIPDEKIFFRVLHTLNDPGKTDRLNYLLSQIQICIQTVSREYPAIVTRIYKLILETILLCNAPTVIKGCSSLLKALSLKRLSVKINLNSMLNTYNLVSNNNAIVLTPGSSKPNIIQKGENSEKLDIAKLEGFIDGEVDASLLSLILAKMGSLMDPSSDIPEDLTIEDAWKLIDANLVSKTSNNYIAGSSLYRILLHQAQEVNLINLVKILYHLEQSHDILGIPKVESLKKNKEQADNKQMRAKKAAMPDLAPVNDEVSYESLFYKLYETTLDGIPGENLPANGEELEWPIGWYLNSISNYSDISGSKRDKKVSDKRKQIKAWDFNEVNKILERAKLAYQKIVEPKDDATDEIKAKYLKEVNSLVKLHGVCTIVLQMAQKINKVGFTKLSFKATQDKAEKFAVIIEGAIQGRVPVKPITYDDFSQEVKTVMAVKDAKESQPESKVENIPATVCCLGFYNHMKDIFDHIFPLNHGNNKIIEGLNHNSILSTSVMTGTVRSHYLNKVSEILRRIYNDDECSESGSLKLIVEKSLSKLKSADISTHKRTDRHLILGCITLIGSWEGSLMAGSEVKLKNNDLGKSIVAVAVPQNTGKLQSVLVNNEDQNLSLQYYNYSQVHKNTKINENIIPSIQLPMLLDSYLKLQSYIEEACKNDWSIPNSKEFNSNLWSQLVALQISSCILLNTIFKHPDIASHKDHPAFDIIIKKSKESLGTPSMRLVFRTFISWESIVDKMSKIGKLMFHPKSKLDDSEMQEKKPETDFKSMKTISNKDSSSYRLPASSYIECLPRSNPKAFNYKVVKHWEKYIIPKIENFVKSSFSEWQMKDYFEQLRMSLRANDHIRAAGIAFKLCDWGLPHGCFLPEADYDWDTIDIEEIEVGSMVRVRLEYRGNSISQKIKHLFNLGLEEVAGEVMLVEPHLKYVLVLIRDDNAMLCLSLWVPQQCVKAIEYPVDRQGHCYSYSDHWIDINKKMSEFQTFISQNILINTISLKDGLSERIDTYQILKWMIISEFNNDLISGWLGYDGKIDSEGRSQTLVSKANKKHGGKLHNLETHLQHFCKDQANVDYLFSKLNQESEDIVKLLNDNNYSLNLKDQLKIDVGQNNKISPLNLFSEIGAPDNSVCSITVTFEKKAYFGLAAGVKFFSDKEGVHLASHLFNTEKENTLSNIPPVLFNSTEIYYQYYYSIEGVPVWDRDRVKSDLPCVVHGIPYSWTPCCWMIDVLSSILIQANDIKWSAYFNNLLKTVLKLSQEVKGPSIIKQMLYKLSTRVLRKVKSFIRNHPNEYSKLIEGCDSNAQVEKLFGVTPEQLNGLMTELKNVLEIELFAFMPKDIFPLYSEFTQDLMELLGTLLSPMKIGNQEYKYTGEKPPKLESLISFIELVEYFNIGTPLSENIISQVKKNLDLSKQADNFLIVNNLPALSKKDILEIITQSLAKSGARMVSKYLDIYLPVNSDDISEGYAVLFLDGWNIPEKEEDLVAPEEEKVVEEPAPAEIDDADRLWVCPGCTIENAMDNDICIACDSPRPPDAVIVGGPQAQPPAKEEPEIPEQDINTVRIKVWHAKFREDLKKFVDDMNTSNKKQHDEKLKQIQEAEEAAKAKANKSPKREKETLEATPEEPLPEPPKEITLGNIELKFGPEILTTNECIEAILNRTVLDEFQVALDKVLDREYNERPEELNKLFGCSDRDSFLINVKECDPVEFIKNLEKLGIDFWLEKAWDEKLFSQNIDNSTIMDIMKMVEKDICNESSYFNYFNSSLIRLVDSNPIKINNPESDQINESDSIGYHKIQGVESKYLHINQMTISQLRCIWEKISLYNKYLLEMLPWINLSPHCYAKMGNELLTLAEYVSNLKPLCFSYIKSIIKSEIMSKTSLRGERTPTIKVERLTEDPDDKGKEMTIDEVMNNLWKMKKKFTFLKAFDIIKKTPVTLLRPEKVKGSGSFVAFKVDLEGENVQGLAGPYRQFFADISAELQLSISKTTNRRTLGMFIPTPNQIHKFGEDRHKYTVNPSAQSSYYLQLFETLGLLMGCAIRTDSHFTLDLPSLFWKKLMGDEPTMTDLELIDKHFVENIKKIESSTPAEFEELGIENFTTKLSNDKTIELFQGGMNTKVTFERKHEYMELSIKARLDESSKQIEALKKGLFQIIPQPYLKIISWKDLEIEVCGTNQVDFLLLKRNTIYSAGLTEESDLIKNFWIVLEEMRESDKLRFIKFCWGQERLPATDDDYKRTQTRFMIKPSMRSSDEQDKLLPKADTCFFNLELPAYSTKDIMSEKILLAINFDSDSLNAEVVINDLGVNDHGSPGDMDDDY